jgi:hypothetical protein
VLAAGGGDACVGRRCAGRHTPPRHARRAALLPRMMQARCCCRKTTRGPTTGRAPAAATRLAVASLCAPDSELPLALGSGLKPQRTEADATQQQDWIFEWSAHALPAYAVPPPWQDHCAGLSLEP